MYSFIDENGDRYTAVTELTINGNTVYAVNSSKVTANYKANLLYLSITYRYSVMHVNIMTALIYKECY